ncbi:MAG: glycine--tRNA ligase subunit beta [Terriglobia bacterium]
MKIAETTSLLFEIGCEEIPARFLNGAERDFGAGLDAGLYDARLLPPGAVAKTASTPRRLSAYVPALAAEQPARVKQIVGPPVRVGLDREGNPTRAAESFAAKNNVSVSDLRRITTAKGEYLAVDVSESGKRSLQVLVEALPSVLTSMTFPKNMYWTTKTGPLFVRPIRWILALLGEGDEAQVVEFNFAGVKSGNFTFGHRLKGSEPIPVSGFMDYLNKLREHMVEPEATARRERVQKGIEVVLEGCRAKIVPDEWLEDWVVNSTEWPVPLMGSFDAGYLSLPGEVLVTVMRNHQKYFAVEDDSGNLKRRFITVLNTLDDPKGLIRHGHERVLRARLADAEFFWKADQKVPLADRIPMLEKITYQAKLGTYADKVRRMRALAEKVCEELEKSRSMNAPDRRQVSRAVELSKCDLTTQMVQEFTELQGVVGGLYAKAQGEAAEVAEAIYDHYRPAGTEDSSPRSVVGAVVSLADKLDSVVAGFSAGLEPNGSSDPFGLRRAGNGVIKLLVEALPGLGLDRLVNYALRFIPQINDGPQDGPLDFLHERMDFYLREGAGLRYDTVRAVLSPNVILERDHSVPSTALARAKALERVRDREDFEALAAAAKRTRNILSKSAGAHDMTGISGDVDQALFSESPERDLHAAYRSLRERINVLSDRGDYEQAFQAMATIRPQVDLFFDKVLVMAEIPAVRRNRLMLLVRLNEDVFTRLADLAEITGESGHSAEAGRRVSKSNGK